MKGEFSEDVGSGVDSHMIRQSLGVLLVLRLLTFLRWSLCGCSLSPL